MKIRVYYADVIPMISFDERDGKTVAEDIDEKSLDYRPFWSGSDRDLDFTYTEDEKTLESVYNCFNEDRPKSLSGNFRSLSVGDVVCLEDRCYLCQAFGWRKLENFEE